VNSITERLNDISAADGWGTLKKADQVFMRRILKLEPAAMAEARCVQLYSFRTPPGPAFACSSHSRLSQTHAAAAATDATAAADAAAKKKAAADRKAAKDAAPEGDEDAPKLKKKKAAKKE